MMAELNALLETAFVYGYKQKMLLESPITLKAIDQEIKDGAYSTQTERVFGTKLERVITPYGELMIPRSPLPSELRIMCKSEGIFQEEAFPRELEALKKAMDA